MDNFLADKLKPAALSIDLTIFMPCLNEEARVQGALDNIFTAARNTGKLIEVLVFDDGSTDRTSERVLQYIQSHPEYAIRLHTLPKNRGLGRNFIDGAFLGGGEYYRTVAGDNYEIPAAHEAILKCLGEADMILPVYRNVSGRSRFRGFLSGLYTFLVNLLSGNSIGYYNGFAVYRRWQVMRFTVESTGFGFQAELITRLIGEGATYKEIELPATAQPGSKALRLRNFLSVAHSLFRIFIRRISRSLR